MEEQREENIKKETEFLLTEAQNKAIKTIYVKVKIGNTQ